MVQKLFLSTTCRRLWSFRNSPADYVVCNYTIDIDFSDDNETLDIREHEILDEDEFSALTGICQKRVRFEDVCKQLCTAVRSGNPVILGADSFYLPTRTQYYNQKHAPHYLLVYEFDLKRKMFTVGENDGIAIFHFTEKEVPFDVIEQTYHSFEDASLLPILPFSWKSQRNVRSIFGPMP